MTASFHMKEVRCPSGCGQKFNCTSLAIAHAQNFHNYDRDAVERQTGLTHYDKELWDMLPLTLIEVQETKKAAPEDGP